MKYISILFQNLLRLLLIFFLAFVWTRYVFQQLWLALLVALIMAIVIDIIIHLFSRRKNRRHNMKIKEQEDAENMFLSLATNANYIDFFLSLAKKESLDCEKKKDFVLIKNFSHCTLLLPMLSLDPLSAEDVASAVRLAQKNKADKIAIVCGEVSKEASALAASLEQDITLFDKFAAYNDLYKYYDLFPEITATYKKSKKLALKELFAFSFNRSRTKGYFLSAIVLLLSTLFVRLNIYYCITSSVLILFAIVSYFNPYFNKSQAKTGLKL